MDEQRTGTEPPRIDLLQRVRTLFGLISGVLFVSAAIWIGHPVTAIRLALVAIAALVIGVTLPRAA